MHDTALEFGQKFFEIYVKPTDAILDVGSMNLNGSLRQFVGEFNSYVGLDIAEGSGVDIVGNAHNLPFHSNTLDIVVSTSCFEHDTMFWISFSEMMRVAKPNGLVYINAPSNGPYHAFPNDCWRFYPDAGKGLKEFATYLGEPCALIESFIGQTKTDVWEDFVAVFRKSKDIRDLTVDRIHDHFSVQHLRFD